MKFSFFKLKQELGPVTGLEGPFKFNSRIVYWDPLAERYWDPVVDHYLTDDEIYELISFRGGRLSVSSLW